MYIGRFAPTPSGPLHFGSIVTAIASFLDAKSNEGKWLVKIDDIDQPRVISGSDITILNTLERLHLYWDMPVVYQSHRIKEYQNQLELLQKLNATYSCQCSRRDILKLAITGVDGYIYSGNCRKKKIKFSDQAAHRIKVNSTLITIKDSIQGLVKQDLSKDIGDFIIKRSDGLFAYQFAVVVDNHLDAVTNIIRGTDLIQSTPRQVYLHQLLKFDIPEFCHIPVATKHQKKISKSYGDEIIVKGNEVAIWLKCLAFLNQPIEKFSNSMNLEEIIHEAIKLWTKSLIKPLNVIEIGDNIHT
jgi:glutamyl-Q tRNA(Asp) synthetase